MPCTTPLYFVPHPLNFDNDFSGAFSDFGKQHFFQKKVLLLLKDKGREK